MTTFTAHNPRIAVEQHRLGLHDRVAVPNGRGGRVIGFYCRASETVLVRFDFATAASTRRRISCSGRRLSFDRLSDRFRLIQSEALQRFADRFGGSARSRSWRGSKA